MYNMLINICFCPITVSIQYSRVSKVIIKHYIRKWFLSFSWAEMTSGGKSAPAKYDFHDSEVSRKYAL